MTIRQNTWESNTNISNCRDDRMGANIKTPKNPWTKNKPQKKSHVEFPSLINFGDMWAPSWILGLFEYPKYPYLNQDTQKYLPNFSTQKNPTIKILNPKKSFHHPHHLKSYTSAWAPCVKTILFCCITSHIVTLVFTHNLTTGKRKTEEFWYL